MRFPDTKTQYPEWAKVAWRYVRVFCAVFFIDFGLSFGLGLKTVELSHEALQALLLASLSAGVVAGFKALRSYLEGNWPEGYKIVNKFVL